MLWISPRSTSKVTSSRAFTPGNSFVIPRMERIVSVMSAPSRRCALGSACGAEDRPARTHQVMSGQLSIRVVLRVNKDLLAVGLVARYGLEQFGRDDLDAVVVRLRVVHGDRATAGDLLDHLDSGLRELGRVLEDRGVLLTGEDRLHALELGVLAGDDREHLAARAVARTLESSDDAARKTVVRSQDAVDVRGGVRLGQDVLLSLIHISEPTR